VRINMRSASILLPIAGLLVAPSVLCAAPSGNAPAPAPTATAAPAQSATTPSEAPAAPVAAPLAAPAETTTTPGNAPASSASPTSVAASPYGPAKPAASTAEPPKPPPPHKDEGPPTLLNMAGDYAIGGFGGIGVMYTRFVGHDAVQVCGEGAVIIDHALTLGGGGCGITTEINAELYGPNPHYANDKMQFGYGGAIIKYHFFSNKPINLGVGALIGAGGISIGTQVDPNQDGPNSYTHQRSWAVFVMEPQVGGYANLTRWLRVGVTAGYRIVAGVKTEGLSSGDFSSPTLGGVIQAGWF